MANTTESKAAFSLKRSGATRTRRKAREREREMGEGDQGCGQAGQPASGTTVRGRSTSDLCGEGQTPKHVEEARQNVGQGVEVAGSSLWCAVASVYPEQFAKFIEAMVEEPCSRSFPESAFKSLMFLERAGEVPEGDQVCRAPSVKNTLEEASLRLQTVELKPAKQALLLPVSIVIAWEQQVCDESAKNYDRIYAWFRLVKLWSGMRFDDTKGVPNRTMELTHLGLKGVINRSKTSGPGKRIVLSPFYVSKDAWLNDRSWLKEGWKLWNSMGVESGLPTIDFMLPGFVRKVVDYPIASAMSQALFNQLTTGKGDNRAPLLKGFGRPLDRAYKRATIRTWAQAGRVPEDVRKMIGRWRPSADEGYERNVRINVLRCQRTLATFIRENVSNSDPFDETSVTQLVEQRMNDVGWRQEDIDGS